MLSTVCVENTIYIHLHVNKTCTIVSPVLSVCILEEWTWPDLSRLPYWLGWIARTLRLPNFPSTHEKELRRLVEYVISVCVCRYIYFSYIDLLYVNFQHIRYTLVYYEKGEYYIVRVNAENFKSVTFPVMKLNI